ncbi:MAG: AEC family transporter [Rhodospirillaceae bacterium]
MLGQIFNVIAPVFICAVVGYVWRRQGRAYDTNFVTTLVTSVGTPCLVFDTLIRTRIEPDAFLTMGLASVLSMAIFYPVYSLYLRAIGWSQRAFLGALTYGNVGNMGLPLCLLAFGEHGLALAIAYFTVNVLFLFTCGVAVSAGAGSPGQLLKLPILYAVTLAMLFIFGGIEAPAWLTNTTKILGGLTVPLMLITLGVSLAGLNVTGFRVATAISLMRLGVGFAAGIGLAELLGLEGAERGVLILQCAMPVAVFNFLFAQRYNQQPERVAGSVVISTIISFATLPFLLAFVM